MFSGIIERTGYVVGTRPAKGHGRVLCVDAGPLARALVKGSSLAVDGVCLTVVRRTGRRAWFDLSPETLRRSTLGSCVKGTLLNLERPVRRGGRFEGHFVLGHVDGVGTVRAVTALGSHRDLEICCPGSVAPYAIEKGSVTVNGVSLTIGRIRSSTIRLHLIPQTLRATNLSKLATGDRVNLEADVLAKLVFEAVRKRRN